MSAERLQVFSLLSSEKLDRNFCLICLVFESHSCLITTPLTASPPEFDIVEGNSDFALCFKVTLLRVAYLLIYFTYKITSEE